MTLRKFVAEQGKVWKVKATGDILSNELYLGINDFIGNYEQVDKPKEEVLNGQQDTTTGE